MPGAMQDAPALPSVGWGYLTSDTQALPLESARTYTVGRRPDSDLVLKSRSVSGEHAVIEVNASGRTAALRDLGSLNGCFINNVRIKAQREPLRHGDNVRFGFDTRVWMVDCTAERVAREQEESQRAASRAATPVRAAGLARGGGGPDAWVHHREGAAAAEGMPSPKPAPRHLQSGQTPNEAFFAHHEPDVFQPRPRAPPPPPREPEQLRTSESDVGLARSAGFARSAPPRGLDESAGGSLREELDGIRSEVRQLREREPAPSKLARRAAASDMAAAGRSMRTSGADATRVARLEQLAVAQQQQLLALRARLGRSDRRILALSARDEGKALLLAEGEARAASQACRLKEEELGQLQASLATLEYAAASAKPGGYGAGAAGALPAELQQFVIERARETASLREKLARVQGANQASSRKWGALERELIAARRERDAATAEARAAREAETRAREGASAAAGRHSLVAAGLHSRVAELASKDAKGGRSSAAKFVVEKLQAATARLSELEAELEGTREALAAREAELRRAEGTALAQAHEALLAPQGASEPESVLLQRAQDELRELREGADPERAQQQQVSKTLALIWYRALLGTPFD